MEIGDSVKSRGSDVVGRVTNIGPDGRIEVDGGDGLPVWHAAVDVQKETQEEMTIDVQKETTVVEEVSEQEDAR